MHQFRRDNEAYLDETFQRFRAELLDRIERSPNVFLDASFSVVVLGGRITHQQATERDSQCCYTTKTKSVK